MKSPWTREHLTEEEKQLPKWAQERLNTEREMGELDTSAPVGFTAVVLLVYGLRILFFVGFCVVVYLIGRAIVT